MWLCESLLAAGRCKRPPTAWPKTLCILAFAVLVASASPASAETWRELLEAVLAGERKDPKGEIVDQEGALEDQDGALDNLPDNPDSPDRTASVPESRSVTRRRIPAREPQVLGAGVAEVAAQSSETVDVEIWTSKPMQVSISGNPVRMPTGQFGFAKAISGSHRLTIVHKTEVMSAYMLSRGGTEVAKKVTFPKNGRNRVAFDVSFHDDALIKIDVERSPTLFRGRTTFGLFHLARDREHTIPLNDEFAEGLELGCGEITIRSTPSRMDTGKRTRFKRSRLYKHKASLEASVCGTSSTSPAGYVEIPESLRVEQKIPIRAGTLSLVLQFDNQRYWLATEKEGLRYLPHKPAWATIELE